MKRLMLLLAAVAILVYAGAALAQDSGSKAEKPKSLQGLLVSITINADDATKATLVVGKEKKVTITVDATTKIRKDEADAKLSDLKVGDMLSVTPASGLAKLIVVRTPKTPAAGAVESGKKAEKPQAGGSLQGVLVSITIDPDDATKATLVVNKEKQVKISVDATTKIRKDEADAKLSDLKAGDMLRVTPASGLAKLVVAKTPKAEEPKAPPAAPKTDK